MKLLNPVRPFCGYGWARLGVFIFLVSVQAMPAGGQLTDEYHVKAAFLYNFARFVEWPPNPFRSALDPFAVCILGDDPFGNALEDVLGGKTLEDRPFRISRISDPAQAAGCAILFVGSAERKRRLTITATIPPSGILTVGESDGPNSDAIIDFTLNQGRVRFQINRRAAERANLKISSRLLSLAVVVDK